MEMKTILASEGKYITQAVLDDESNRIFVKKLSGFGINENDWREAEQAEKEAWEAEHIEEEFFEP